MQYCTELKIRTPKTVWEWISFVCCFNISGVRQKYVHLLHFTPIEVVGVDCFCCCCTLWFVSFAPFFVSFFVSPKMTGGSAGIVTVVTICKVSHHYVFACVFKITSLRA